MKGQAKKWMERWGWITCGEGCFSFKEFEKLSRDRRDKKMIVSGGRDVGNGPGN